MDDENKPVIETEVKDYSESNKKSKNIYIAILLTIIFVGCAGYVFYSVNKMLGEAGHVGDELDEATTVSTTSRKQDNISIETVELDNSIVFLVTNNDSSVVDLTFTINTYKGSEINGTVSKEILGFSPSYQSIIVVKNSELGDYDNYKYDYKTSTSIYKSAQKTGLVMGDTIESDDSFKFNITNDTGSSISSLTLSVLFYSGSDLVDVKSKTLYGVDSSIEVNISKSSLSYDTTRLIYTEAYYN